MNKWVKFFKSEPKEVVTYYVENNTVQDDGQTHEFVDANDAVAKSTNEVLVVWDGTPISIGTVAE